MDEQGRKRRGTGKTVRRRLPGPAVKIKLTPSEVVGWGGRATVRSRQQGSPGLLVGKSFQADSTPSFRHRGLDNDSANRRARCWVTACLGTSELPEIPDSRMVGPVNTWFIPGKVRWQNGLVVDTAPKELWLYLKPYLYPTATWLFKAAPSPSKVYFSVIIKRHFNCIIAARRQVSLFKQRSRLTH